MNDKDTELLQDCHTALEWLLEHYNPRLTKEGEWGCTCSESGGYMEYDTNAYIHTEDCAVHLEDHCDITLKHLRDRLGLQNYVG